MDAATLAALLAALVPVALFWALIHKRKRASAAAETGARAVRPAPQGAAQKPMTDAELAADSQSPATTGEEQAQGTGADSAAAAAGGALILGYELSHRASGGSGERDEKSSEH